MTAPPEPPESDPQGRSGWRDAAFVLGSILLPLWLIAGAAISATGDLPFLTGLGFAAVIPVWLLAVFGSLALAGFGGAICAAAGFAAVRAGRRLTGSAFASLAVLHGAAWQVGVLLNWQPLDAEAVVVGGLTALPLLAGVAVLTWIARGGGLDAEP